jgi:ribonuclease III family protein
VTTVAIPDLDLDLAKSLDLGAVNLQTIKQVSPVALAYLGDAVYELYIRRRYLFPLRRQNDYHKQVVAHVKAEAQAKILEALQPQFTPAEQEILRQGRNAASGGPKRLSPAIYQQATALETLFGYLYLTDMGRLKELLGQLKLEVDP